LSGIYSRLNQWVREMKSNDAIVIDRQDLVDRLDYSEMDRDELETRCKNADVGIILYQNGFRSVVRGKGVFIDYLKMKNPKAIEQLIANAKQSADKKRKVELAIRNALKNLEESEDYGSQMAFDEDMTIFEEMTREELIQALREMIHAEEV